jgi:hypothetical protein
MEGVTKMKPGSNSGKDHPQLSHNGHSVDGALVGAGSLLAITSTWIVFASCSIVLWCVLALLC